jgi:hypothetical protein
MVTSSPRRGTLKGTGPWLRHEGTRLLQDDTFGQRRAS